MLTSFFRKSKPINFLAAILLATIFYAFYNISILDQAIGKLIYIKKIALCLFFIGVIFFTNFTTSIEKAKNRDTYVIYIFTLLCIASPAVFRTDNIMVSVFLVILGLRRTLALQTGLFYSKKVFDSSFCFILSSIFFPPALIFLAIPFLGIIFYCANDYKHWFIPPTAVLAAFILMTCFTLLTANSFFLPLEYYHLQLHFNDAHLNNQLLYPLGLALISGGWFYANILISHKKLPQKQRKANYILLLFIGLSMLILSLSPSASTLQSVFFLFIPIALFGGQYFQTIHKTRLNELILVSLTVIALVIGIILQWILT